MLKVDFSDEFVQSIANEVVKQVLPTVISAITEQQVKPILSRVEFMELAGIGESKCNELFHRRDFPVNREMGHPKVLSKAFFEWVYATNQNAREVNLKYPLKVI